MQTTIQTIDGKTVQVSKACIRVSKHDWGFFNEVRLFATLPGCRTVKQISIAPFFNTIHLQPLYGYNGQANISPENWRTFLKSLAVVSDDLFPLTITPEIEAQARQNVESICDCPAVRNAI